MVSSKRSISRRRQAITEHQRDRDPQKNSISPQNYPVANLPRGAVMENVGAAPETAAPVQAKLTIGQVGDKYEREADSVAAQVVSQLNRPVQKPAEEGEVQRKPSVKITAPRTGIQRRASSVGGNAADPQFEADLNRTRGKGQALDTHTQTQMGSVMGANFSGVIIHADAKADGMCDAIQAKAFTTGTDVYFKQGTYQPSTSQGQELIAHELTHVVQQNADAVQRKMNTQIVQRDGLSDVSGEAVQQLKEPKYGTPEAGLAKFDRSIGYRTSRYMKLIHLKHTYCQENLFFLEAFAKYRASPSRAGMLNIFNTYIDPGAEFSVNVSSGVRNNIIQSIAHQTTGYLPFIFHTASMEIEGIMGEPAKRYKDTMDLETGVLVLNFIKMGDLTEDDFPSGVSRTTVESYIKFKKQMAKEENQAIQAEIASLPWYQRMNLAARAAAKERALEGITHG